MKTKISRIVVSAVLLALSIQGLKAQDTIDTAYYRYSIHTAASWGHPFAFYDTLTGQYPTDPETGEYISVCPNGKGFQTIRTNHNVDYVINEQHYYQLYNLGAPESDLYGIALQLRDIDNFTVGDSMVATLFEWPDHTNLPIPIDSIVINGGNIGKRRWMEIPLLQGGAVNDATGQLTQSFCSTIHENCIGYIAYLPIMEFYFDTVRHIASDSLWYMLKIYYGNGSRFSCPVVETINEYRQFVRREAEDYNRTYEAPIWHTCFPITSPLPDWEVSSLDTLIPMPTKPDNPDPGDPQNPDDPNNPSDPNNPDNPDNPQDPNNPDNPQDPDPDNPGGDEGIGEAVGSQQSAVSIYPNPASGVTTVSSEEPIIDLVVRDMAGRTVVHRTACGTTATFDTSTLRKGVYLVKVTTARGNATKKLVVE